MSNRESRMAANAYAKRLMEKPIPEGMNGDPAYRIFYDPPELIHQAMGGPGWFMEMELHTVHRVGLMGGLAWCLPEWQTNQIPSGVNRVKVTARRRGLEQDTQFYDILFLNQPPRQEGGDPTEPHPPAIIVDHRAGLTAEQLKSAYAEVLGEVAV